MDNLRAASYLLELMKEYNRVSLPCLGSFVGSYQTSSIEKKNKIHPPYKKINFYQNEIWNDEKLEKLLAKRERLSLGKAKEILAFWIDGICLMLANGEKIELPNIGEFHVNKDNRLIFTQETQENLLLDSFGLNSINLEPTEGITFHLQPNIQLIEKTRSKKKTSISLIFIFILVFLVIGTIFTLISITKERNANINKNLGLNNNVTEKILLPIKAGEEKVSGVTFRILVSSHEKYNEARVKIKSLEKEGYSPLIYSVDENDNKYGVCIGNFDTKTQAKYMLDKIIVLDSTNLFKTATILPGTPSDKVL